MNKHTDPVLDIAAAFREEDELDILRNSDDVQKLRSILDKDEVVYRLVLGFHDESDGVLVATNKRVVFVDKKFISSFVVSFEYADIAAVIYSPELTTYRITLAHSNGALTLNNVDRDHGDRFISFIRDAIGQNYTALGKNKRALMHSDDIIRLSELHGQDV